MADRLRLLQHLGFDLDREIIAGRFPSIWSAGGHIELVAHAWQPIAFPTVQDRGALSELLWLRRRALGAATITLIHMLGHLSFGRLGTILHGEQCSQAILEWLPLATVHGAHGQAFSVGDLEELERASQAGPRGTADDLHRRRQQYVGELLPISSGHAALRRAYDALLYVDDGHGFGIIGERSPGESCPYGQRGNSIVRHFRRELRPHHARVGPFEVVLVARSLFDLPTGAQAAAQDRCAADLYLRTVPDSGHSPRRWPAWM